MRSLLNSDTAKYTQRAKHYEGPMGPWLEHLVEDEALSLGMAREALICWEALPFIDPEYGHMATLIKRNKEVHFAAFRRFRRKGHISARRISSFLQPILNKEVFLVTKVASDESSTFIERLGFEELGTTMDGVRTFILNRIRYTGAKT